MDEHSLEQMLQRIGRAHLSKRMRRQAQHVSMRYSGGGPRLYLENLDFLPIALKYCLKLTGQFRRTRLNTMAYRVVEQTINLNNLGPNFDGYRILHLSDIHIDGIPDGGEALTRLITTLDYDLCVITGDYRFLTWGPYQATLDAMRNLTAAINCPGGIVGILGNHDFIEMVPDLENMGIQMLLNETLRLHRDNEHLCLVGVDDPHYYETHDLSKALQGVDKNSPTILLTHSPEMIPEAAEKNIDYYLCGHSHGGQICLPGNIPIFRNARCNREFVSGAWSYNEMQGYTSPGAGASGLAARIFCPPEVTIHTLTSSN